MPINAAILTPSDYSTVLTTTLEVQAKLNQNTRTGIAWPSGSWDVENEIGETEKEEVEDISGENKWSSEFQKGAQKGSRDT